MSKNIRLFFTAFGISFLGSLPIGTLNTNVANYSLKHNLWGAGKFGVAAILVEIILVRIALVALDKVSHFQKIFKYISVVMCLVILYLAYKSLEAAFHMKNFEDVLPFVGMSPFYSGLILSMLNPLHLPFWLGWTAVLKSKNILGSGFAQYNIYITGIGLGTCISFIIYAFAGNFLMNTLKAQHNLINWILGCTLLLTGVVLAYKIIANKIILKGAKTTHGN